MPSKREINIVNDEDRNELIIYIGMKPRIDTSIEFNLMSLLANGQQAKLTKETINIKAILLPSLPGDE